MAGQQSDASRNTGQNVLLVAIIVVLIYIVLDIFGFIPGIKMGSKRKQKGGLYRALKENTVSLGVVVVAAVILTWYTSTLA